jgi:8-oxo-dGTP pyrophosphatase MutT (NUDIX family)
MSSFIETIQEKLSLPLPGIDAQMKMAPPIRAREMQAPDHARKGGVMILLFEADKIWHTILIRRTEDGKTHGGQISFPGGQFDHHDESIIATACRECEEEIGIPRQDIQVLGTLSPLYIPPSNFLVTPTIGWVHHNLNFKASEIEVQEIIRVPLDLLFYDAIKDHQHVKRSDDASIEMKTPVYKLNEDLVIWGATAMMISELEHLIKV